MGKERTSKDQDMSMLQTVEITLADGRIGIFSGPALVRPQDEGGVLRNVRFFPATPMPKGAFWGPLDDAKAKS